MEKFRQSINEADDPRTGNATRHDFLEMLMIALISSLSDGQTCVDVADCAEYNEDFLRQFMRLEHGPPSHDAFSWLFRIIEPEPFVAALARFASDWADAMEAEGVRQTAVNGKALRRTFSRAEELSPLHLVSTFTPGAGIVLGQVAVDRKSNEIRALPALLEVLDLKGATVTADAMRTQRDTSELIIEKDGDYVLALKGNQRSLHKDAKDWLEDSGNSEKMISYQKAERGHGRDEMRTATVSRDIGPLQDAHQWPCLAAVGKVEAVRVSEGRTRTETRYYIMSRKMSPEDFLESVRNHWAIKDKLHWVLDVQMREDELRNRTGRDPETMAGIRRLALNIVRLMDDNLSVRRRLLRALHVPEYRLELISNAAKLAETI